MTVKKNLSNLKTRLIDEETSLSQSEQTESAFFVYKFEQEQKRQMKNSRNEKKFKNQSRDIDKAKITCFSCRKKGHYARDCHSKSRGKANVPERSKGPNYSAFSSEIRLVDLKKNLLSEGVIATKGMKIIKMYDYVDIYNCENELVGTA
ncbi:hypothetical protein AVEN_36312-1, partial [Araneus ventricosus]